VAARGPLAAQTEQETKYAEAESLYARAVGLYQKGDRDSLAEAVKTFQSAALLYHSLGKSFDEAVTLSNIGLAYDDLDERQKALDSFNQALPLYRAVGHRKGEATALNNLGLINNELGARERALDYYSQALPLYRAIGDRAGEAGTLYNLSALERARGDLTVALTHIESAVSIVESLRVKIDSRELRSSYFATVQNYYELYVDLLMQLHKLKPSEGFDGRALQASERGRARSLLESLAEANADIRQGVAPELLERERELQRRLNAAAQEQLRAAATGRADEEASAKKLDALADEYRQNETRIRQNSPHYAALTQPRPLSPEEIQEQVLDKDTLLLQYSLGTERSYLWVMARDSVDSFELPRRAEIEDAARAFYSTLADGRKWTDGADAAAMPEAAQRLSRMILAPAAKLLGSKRLVVVADGALQFIPFAALPTPDAARLQAGVEQQAAGDY
jgi:tetratricopeptide (TPR) repeat protein